MKKESLRNVLLKQYAAHYSRVNSSSISKIEINKKNIAAFKAMYGKYLADLPAGSYVLDAGCGTGILINMLLEFPNINAYGVDISESQVEIARKNIPETEIACEDALGYLYKNENKFAGIFCTDVIEHLETKDDCFEFATALYNSLTPDGFCVVRVPNAANLTGGYSRYMDLTHERAFTRTSLIQLMEAAGFQNVQPVPIIAKHLTGKIRLILEKLFHLMIFRVCGRDLEYIFTSNIIVAGRKLLQ
jgi:2-polyprenyl-3-methyl-5-hydroxy-6-metoxy-1,4-benzoquinol methylase